MSRADATPHMYIRCRPCHQVCRVTELPLASRHRVRIQTSKAAFKSDPNFLYISLYTTTSTPKNPITTTATMSSKRPFIVIVPGASTNPSHYGYLFHLLQRAGYPTFSALLPSVGASSNVTADDDTQYVRNSMLLPILDHEQHDVILVSHSYSADLSTIRPIQSGSPD
ncbi:hypothetical protein BDV95DRAFT_611690 [Massariosphaeria phaeospora]|uniref:AB hydrolase-1 domain-containing protein n=1 Tax=Massariosphaeria phaeospora TaxID=100035 RepID=A0A7C8M103_9PLEO|nr:hypothetical protein BDV95DRAFT_611690 [Massariosphaeria phaeospora]